MTGQRIRDLRKKRGLSQTELANIVHVSQQTITAWENNKADPSSSAIAALADYFDVTTDYLLGRSVQTVKEDIHNEFDLLLDDISTHIKHLTQADKEMIHSLAQAYLQNKEKACTDFE